MANVYAALAASHREAAVLKDTLRRRRSEQPRIRADRGNRA
ncbi:hypothetical protein ACGFIG_15070 [Micromonospora sp. NPDC049048]